ncbi:carbonic anhydrase [Pseudoduganella umbonata]|uniref:carbonic anhydrase n=1 Tax=Pseudoduganella umbonata TaxID=864828 RepID=A0A4P8I015_9BURK|nr:carbonic anhydrase family protein [Pseudoduganella umbonata]MBB3221878.1 carbonic anhydrase [Pseudoduganella umbonata]QCP14320.1 carbonic anhydrase family protein [Pseudoduganella umbonata]
MKLAIAPLAALAVAAGAGAAGNSTHWEYQGKAGAEHWGELAPEFSACREGKAQSPVNIRAHRAGTSAPIGFGYRAGSADIVNNGHTVQVDLADGGGIEVAGTRYRLVQFHFHTPSEEAINGRRYPLVAHLVHKNDAGELAVVAVLFRKGRDNAALAPVFAGMPAAAGEKRAAGVEFDPATLLPARRSYYGYTGSLTTPPCSEGVRWHILKQPVEVSPAQLAAFRKLYRMNARPVQPLNGREVVVNP